MILFNLCGGPGSGKSMAAKDLYLSLKRAGYRVEETFEVARQLIYNQNFTPKNEFLIAGLQYERARNLAEAGMHAAVCDSPILQCAVYGKNLPYMEALLPALRILESEFEVYNIFVLRQSKFDKEARVHDEAASLEADEDTRRIIGDFWLEIEASDGGHNLLEVAALNLMAQKIKLT